MSIRPRKYALSRWGSLPLSSTASFRRLINSWWYSWALSCVGACICSSASM